MGSLRLACAVSALLALMYQTAAISEDAKAALNEACDKDFVRPIRRVPHIQRMTLEECKEMIEKIPGDVNEATDMYTGATTLIKAAGFGLVEVAKELIEAGADVDRVNTAWGHFDTALFVAAKYGRPRVCEVLLNAGADMNMKNNDGYGKTAIEIAMENNQNEVVNVLKKHGASVPHLGLAEILQFHGLSSSSELNEFPNKKIMFNRQRRAVPPLMFAAGVGNKEAVALLLDAGADVDFPDGAPLIMAVGDGFADVARLLVEAGADVNKEGGGETPLMRVVEAGRQNQGHKDIVKMLIEAGAELDAMNSEGETALYLAANGGHDDIARMLVEAGADTSMRPQKTYWKTEQNMRYLEELSQELNNQG